MGEQGLSEAKKRSNLKWDSANLKRLSLAMPIGQYERLKQHLEKVQKTQNGFINEAIDEKIANDESADGSQDTEDR